MALGFHYYRRRLARLRLGRLAALTAVAAALTALALAAAQMKPLLTSLATTRVSNAVTQIVTQSVDEAIASGELDYENLVNFEKDNDGKITAVRSNMAAFNLLQSHILQTVLERINQVSAKDLSIPIGSLTGSARPAVGPGSPCGWSPWGPLRPAFKTPSPPRASTRPSTRSY